MRKAPVLVFVAADRRATDRRDEVKIEIGPGERVALIGPSGSGKTTAIEALLGARESVLESPSVSGRAARSVRLELPHIGVRYLTESPVFETGTVLTNCLISAAECQHISAAIGLFPGMTDAELSTFLTRQILPSGEPLSLGERQRVQIIRAMGAKPRVLVLDEALSGVEEDLEREVISALIADESISSLLYVGHRKSIQELFSKKIRL